MNDQDRISPYNIDTLSSIQVMRIKKNINEGEFSNFTNITRTAWQTVRRITSEILGVKVLTTNCTWNHVVTYTHWTTMYLLSSLKLLWIHWIQTDWQLAHWKQMHHSIPLPYSTWHLSNFLIFYQNLSTHLSRWSCILQLRCCRLLHHIQGAMIPV